MTGYRLASTFRALASVLRNIADAAGDRDFAHRGHLAGAERTTDNHRALARRCDDAALSVERGEPDRGGKRAELQATAEAWVAAFYGADERAA